MSIIENNELIAQFMGANSHKVYVDQNTLEYELYGVIECIQDGPDEKHFFYPKEMLFYKSWDWLMPVVEKIENLGFTFEIGTGYVDVGRKGDPIIDDQGLIKIEVVYQVVVNFIKWYSTVILDYTTESGETYTEEDFMSIAKGNREYALLLRQRVEWQHPETIVDEDLREGEIVEENGTYKIVK